MRTALADDAETIEEGNPPVVGVAAAFSLADFELLEELGRGGMAIVYRARQKSVGRVVALKLLQPGRMLSAGEVERFQREAETVARLEHPHIVPLFDAGEDRGQPWCAMKFVPGGSLAERIGEFRAVAGERQRFAVIAEMVRKVALAIHHAHQRGVLHRDLKPSNVLLDEAGEPFVTDFGLARVLDQDSALTRTGAFFGSPAYTAPEQAASDRRQVTVAADVYGVGAILYELLAGRPPFSGATPFDTLRQVVETVPVQPSLINPGVSPDLETICLKCLEKDPAQRYASAQEWPMISLASLATNPFSPARSVKPPGCGAGAAANPRWLRSLQPSSSLSFSCRQAPQSPLSGLIANVGEPRPKLTPPP
jgi:serine/threonine-protein kinase